MGHVRGGGADDAYANGVWGRGEVGRKPAQPRSIEDRILDVPEFEPGD
jgi:hypothetical protein